MSRIADIFVDALLADSAYAEGLFDGISQDLLTKALEKPMTTALATFIAHNFEVVSNFESETPGVRVKLFSTENSLPLRPVR
ncbi:MAG: hypothetical protein ABI583_07070 [Betaproteobacteria bacterium]